MGKRLSRREVAIRFYESIGYKQVPTTSTKYVKLYYKKVTLWIGKLGAVRCGRTVSESYSITDRLDWSQMQGVAEKEVKL